MLTPDQIEVLQDTTAQLLDPVVEYLIREIAARVAQAGQLTATASYQVWRAQQLGVSQYEIKRRVAQLLKISQAQAEQLFRQAAEVGYRYDLERLPSRRGIPFKENTVIQQIVSASVQMARDGLSNITQTMGFVGPDGRVEELTTAFIKACDFAHLQAATGATSFVGAVRQATAGLRKRGIQFIDYESGKSYTVEAAVRRNVWSAAGIMQEKIGRYNFEAMGADGWEISAHAASAPDHEPIQGKQYSDEAYTRLNNSLIRRIGTLNCGHTAFPIILGVTTPQYTPEALEKLREENEKGIEYNGKHYTLYEATQRQRKIEREIRETKRRILIDEATGDSQSLGNDQVKYQLLRQEYKRFNDASGLRPQYERAEMAGFGPKQARASEKAYKEMLKAENNGVEGGDVPKLRVVVPEMPTDTAEKAGTVPTAEEKPDELQQKKEPAESTPQDVTAEYAEKAKPGEGTITFEDGYKISGHSAEISVAEWLRDTYGGDIKLLTEKPGQKMPDYEWQGKMWELKTISSVNSADKNLQKALKQIAKNPGGVILDAGENEFDIDAAEKEISRRIGRHQEFDLDVLIRKQGETNRILRYKKTEGR